MNSERPNDLLKIRPQVALSSLNQNMSSDERFQNTTIRPIVKLQELLLVEVFKNYSRKHKSVFYDLSLEKRIVYIENAIQKDMKFRNSIKGMIIGHLTIEEYKLYIQNSSALNKRMMNIAKDSLIDNIQLLEKSKLLEAI